MELNTLHLKNYKKAYSAGAAINLLAIAVAFTLVKTGYYILSPFYALQNVTRPALVLLFAGSLLSGWLYKKKIKQLDDIEKFEDKLAKHEKIYQAKILWLIINCCGTCFLYVLTAHNAAFYLAIFEFVMYLPAFPNKLVIQKELQNNEIIFL